MKPSIKETERSNIMNELEMLCSNYVAGLNLAKEGILPIMPELGEIIEEAHYDSIMEMNVFRKGCNHKAKSNGKRNAEKTKRLHKADRIHGKHRELTRKEQELVHYDATKGVHGAGVWYTCRGKKIVPIVSKGKKTNRNYYEKKYSYPAKEREQEYI